MANLVGRIKDSLPDGCIALGRLRKEGCSVSLKNAPTPSVTIDMDKRQAPVGGNETKCDYIFVGGSGKAFLVLLELTKQDLNARKIVRQLRAGANIAARIISWREQVKFLPVAVCGGKIHRAEIRRLLQSKIRYKNKNSTVRLLKCGAPLIEALSKEI